MLSNGSTDVIRAGEKRARLCVRVHWLYRGRDGLILRKPTAYPEEGEGWDPNPPFAHQILHIHVYIHFGTYTDKYSSSCPCFCVWCIAIKSEWCGIGHVNHGHHQAQGGRPSELFGCRGRSHGGASAESLRASECGPQCASCAGFFSSFAFLLFSFFCSSFYLFLSLSLSSPLFYFPLFCVFFSYFLFSFSSFLFFGSYASFFFSIFFFFLSSLKNICCSCFVICCLNTELKTRALCCVVIPFDRQGDYNNLVMTLFFY